jgi:hypothetical protein
MRDNKEISKIERKTWKFNIKLKQSVDMGLLIASLIQFLNAINL